MSPTLACSPEYQARQPESALICDPIVTYRVRVDEVFKALADPTRRALLDALFADGGRSTGQLCAVVPQLTRFAVMKHLTVLEAANLVVVIRQGRVKRHYLNAVPIAQIADRWIAKYALDPAAALAGLATRLDPSAPPAPSAMPEPKETTT